ncbi:MAG: phosphoribosylformylglycinamidine synthase subunit PurL [Bacteroidales bacterium]|nr:phosphoribosylformylglycinamidine synthase subunit PurL [Bacteroidales bacterium]
MVKNKSLDAALQLGLLEEEYDKIVEILGREPNFTEVSIFSVMWSEHASYKNSIYWIKQLPRKGDHLLAEAGEENAGLVDLGNGLACAFKIESHNHPSAVEPYQGAATGVGGINRDIFTMGARPIAQLNSLRFGKLELDKTKWLLKGVVKGIGDYGNSFGVPVVGGEVYFDETYNENPLVNAMSVGIVNPKNVISAISKGKGNPIYIVGSRTGKDGIHGATFASADLSDHSHEDLPAVQVGDPFQEKLLMEATLELSKTDAIVGMQDMGAAGIICSTSEMSEKGNHGMRIYLDKVPLRQKNMESWEILLSESQERMLLVADKGKEKIVEDIFAKWDLQCTIIGEVIEEDILEFYMHDELVAKIPASVLVLGGGAPIYQRPYKEPAYLQKINSYNIDDIPEPENLKALAMEITRLPSIASKNYIIEQYDTMVGTANMTTNFPTDAGIVNLKNSEKALAITTDCNSNYVFADPDKGTQIAVAEAARNIVCSGGKPIAISNCLNFGNPYNQEVFWQFVGTIKGMSTACKKFETPVTGGNVSFYNQTTNGDKTTPIKPTPVIGMLGILEDKNLQTTLSFKNKGDLIFLIGKSRNDISQSEYLRNIVGVEYSPAPYFDLEEEYQIQKAVQELIHRKLICSAHDISEGGLWTALLESSFKNKLGFDITTDAEVREDAFLFGESQSRIIVSVRSSKQDRFIDLLQQLKIPFSVVGHVTKGEIRVDDISFGYVTDLQKIYDNAIEETLKED